MMVLAFGLAAACLYLSYALVHTKQSLARLKESVEDLLVHKGDVVRTRSTDKSIRGLAETINLLSGRWHDAVRRNKTLEQANKRILSNVAHDLQTPLTAILGYVEALQKSRELTESERSRYLQIVFDKASRLSLLFRSFFELVKVESEEDVAQRLERIDLTRLMAELEGEATEEAALCGMELEVSRPADPLYVWGVPSFMDRIMHNLLSNAFRYGKSGGYIGITVKCEAGQVRINIVDRGPGIAKHDLPYIFERLYRGERSRTSALLGSGLGLTITKALVDKMNGHISVRSEPHVETVFTLVFPEAS